MGVPKDLDPLSDIGLEKARQIRGSPLNSREIRRNYSLRFRLDFFKYPTRSATSTSTFTHSKLPLLATSMVGAVLCQNRTKIKTYRGHRNTPIQP